MAKATSKLSWEIIRSGAERYFRDVFSAPKFLTSVPNPKANRKAFSGSMFTPGASPLEHSTNVISSCRSQYLLVSNIPKGPWAHRFSAQSGLKVLATKSRAAHDCGLRTIRNDFKLQPRFWSSHSKVNHDAILPMKSSGGILGGRRTYHVDRQGIQHFKRRGPASWSEKFTQRRMVTLAFLVGGGLVVYVANRQVVPYTHRKHFVLISPRLERAIGDQSFQMLMQEYKGRLLPTYHPQNVRVHQIANQIIEALMSEVGADDWSKADHHSVEIIDYAKEWERAPAVKVSEKPLLEPYDSHTHTEDETMDEMWVDKSRQYGVQAGQQGYTKHLEGMKWKVVVVDDDIVNAICIPGGKIVVFTGLLKKFRSDAEVATVIGHEVGHAVARHSAEGLTRNIFIIALQLAVLSVFYVPQLVSSVSELLLRLPFSRRMEIEADHVGLILMAAAGYDPRLAPGFYERLGKLESAQEYAQYLSTHPSGKKRGELLKKSATMDEALGIYQRREAGRGVEGFF